MHFYVRLKVLKERYMCMVEMPLMIFITLIICSICWLVKRRFTFWEQRGITTHKSLMKFTKETLTKKIALFNQHQQVYEEFKSQGLRHGGLFLLVMPIYVPIDLDIVKAILQADFHHFMDRGIYANEKGDPLSAHLFSLSGNKWKLLRQKLTPTFTSGKMKMMFGTLVNCTNGLCKVIDSEFKNGVDVKDLCARFTTDIIGNCAFGLDCNTLENPHSEFRKNGEVFFKMRNFKTFFLLAIPDLMLKLNTKLIPVNVSKFFMGVINDTISHREEYNIYRKDFLHLLIQLKNRGKLVDDHKLFDGSITVTDNSITFEEIAAQAFVFYMAGFETSSTTMTFCLYELAKNKHIQEKVRQEIRRVLYKHDNEITYDAVMEMYYLEQTVLEALRKYPPLSYLPRICTEQYRIPGSNIVLEKGQRVVIPVIGIQRDPEYYPEPEKFDPDRFSEENRKTRPAISFLPFGEGPRTCIGLRFGMLQTKVGLAALLSNYEISVNAKTKEPLEFDPKAFITSTINKVWLDFKKIGPS